MTKQFKYEVFLKLTEQGNIYVGFTPENKIIQRGNKNSWTSQYQFLKTSNGKVVTNLIPQTWQNIGVDYYKVNKLCEYITEKIKIGLLNKLIVYQVFEKDMKTFLFEFFHTNSPVYKDKQRLSSSLGLCSAKLTEVDETDEFFDHQENIKSKMPDLRSDHLKPPENIKETKIESTKVVKPIAKTMKEKSAVKTEKIITKLDKNLLLI